MVSAAAEGLIGGSGSSRSMGGMSVSATQLILTASGARRGWLLTGREGKTRSRTLEMKVATSGDSGRALQCSLALQLQRGRTLGALQWRIQLPGNRSNATFVKSSSRQ